MKGSRIDRLLVERGFAGSRTKAQALVMSGVVLVNDQRVDKASETFPEECEIRIKGESPEIRYAGRGGLKLEKALADFHICVDRYVCIDIGSSTGGFTDCLLKQGALRVYAVDAGTNQLVWDLRNDPRVVVMEKTNARHLRPEDFEEQFDLATMDVSFISATKLFPSVLPLLKQDGKMIVLVKPQFEVGKGEVGKGGVVRDESKRQEAVNAVLRSAESIGFVVEGIEDSPILGAAGNKEFLVCLRKDE